MKVNSFYLRAASIACTLLLFNACGKDGEPDKPSPEDNTSTVVEAPGSRPPEPPQSEPSAPTRQEQPVVPANWIGTSAEYAATFEERLEDAEVEKIITVEVPLLENAPDDAEPTTREEVVSDPHQFGRLYARAEARPHTGVITRIYLSGAPEFRATFKDGFRNGIAYWWSAEGVLLKAVEGWGGLEKELDVNATASPLEAVKAELADHETDPSRPVFRGGSTDFDKWGRHDDEGRLIDARTGEVISGLIQLYGSDGKVQMEEHYQNGQLHGDTKHYHANGIQSMKVPFSGGKKFGTETWWGDNGLKTYEANYLNDELNGLETIWDETGAIVTQYRYQDGKLVETVYER